jgi:hypothetical protein
MNSPRQGYRGPELEGSGRDFCVAEIQIASIRTGVS